MAPPKTEQDMPPVPPGFKRFVSFVLVAFLLGFIGLMVGPTLMEAWQEHRLLEDGTDASATILSLEDTNDTVNERPVVRLGVQVTAEGLEPYNAQIVTPLSVVDLVNYKVGAQVRVRYDPADPSKVALVGLKPIATP